MKEIEKFRQWGSLTPGHPEYGHTPGVETTTGPLGQGLATAVGMAMAEASPGRPLRRRPRRPPHLGDRRRRLPDGRRQPRGDQHRRPPEAVEADRAVRRQQHHHRRRRHHLGPATSWPLQGRRLGGQGRRRPRPRQDRRRPALGHQAGPPDPDRLQDQDLKGAGPRRRPPQPRLHPVRRPRSPPRGPWAGTPSRSPCRTTSPRPGRAPAVAAARSARPGNSASPPRPIARTSAAPSPASCRPTPSSGWTPTSPRPSRPSRPTPPASTPARRWTR
jgi:hypothetical protein